MNNNRAEEEEEEEKLSLTRREQSVLITAITELERLNGFLLQNELINRRPKKMHREEVVVHGMSRVK
ncbi:hypothetical protein T10_1185 [Trichinella papuae]|uniref:Uncharacterized protein n=1 Tax=Trichinella papuae TaxID=268474 RepID=A0A0V1MM59_9BILA|nr:hypothetical protein T10_1185 [Trichinella papuae]